MRCDTSVSLGALLLGFIGAAGLSPGHIMAQAGTQAVCTDGRVANIFVDNHSIFDTSVMAEGTPFLWGYRLANSLHWTTRADFIESELLFGVGDCMDPFLLHESERILRQYGFLARVDVFSVAQPDGSQHVVVSTQDEFTTEFNIRASFDEGLDLEGVDLTEENLFGRGIQVGGFLIQRREQKDKGVLLATPRLFNTRLDGRIRVGNTRVGTFVDQGLFYPFVGETGRFALRQSYFRRETLFSYSVADQGEVTNITLPFFSERAEVTFAKRFGEAGNLTFFGVGLSREVLEFTDLSGGPEIVRDHDFGNREAAPQEIVDLLAPQVVENSATRINLILGKRNLSFVRRRGLDALDGVQDVAEGTEVTVTLGRTLGFLQDDGEGTSDLFTRLAVFGGLAPGPWVLSLAASLEGRQIFSDLTGLNRDDWRDVIGEFDLYSYWHPEASRNTVFMRLSGASGWRMNVPFQLTLGGAEGVRGFNTDGHPGGRRLIASIENRTHLDWSPGGLMDTGISVFADAGKTWEGDIPFGVNSGVQASIGAGLRLGFPRGTRGVFRIDIALPTTGPDSFSSPILRITAFELLGLIRGFEDNQLKRSRRAGVGASLISGGIGR